MRTKKCISIGIITLWAMYAVFASEPAKYRIAEVRYDIKGSTREFPLSQKVEVDRERVFASEEDLKGYVSDFEVKLRNQRVLESANVDIELGTVADAEGVNPVTLVVHTVDTWNIIALPYPKIDSNNGAEVKLKIKNYNFFGSMEEMNFDTIFSIDNEGDKDIETNFDFSIPFKFQGYAVKWSLSSSLIVPFGEVPEYNLKTGLDLTVPIHFADMHFGGEQGMTVNARDDDDNLEDDHFYLSEKVYVNVPFTLYEFDYFGKLRWTPEASVTQNWNTSGIQDPDLTGPDLTLSHALSLGRVDWVGNFRKGFNSSISNNYVWDFHDNNGWDISVSGAVAGYYTFFDLIGVNSRVTGFRVLRGDPEEKAGTVLRGILDKRVMTDALLSFNFDLPIKIMHVNFEEITGVHWTRYIGFEMQASPFFDMALTHDSETGRNFALEDGWYSGGLEILVFPLKMRSIFIRGSLGVDLAEFAQTGKITGNSERDEESVHEYFIGIGLLY